MPNYLAGFERPVLSGPAPALDLEPPIAEIKSNEVLGDLRKIRMNVKSQRNAGRIYLRFDKEAQPVSVNLASRELVPIRNSRSLTINLAGPFPSGADLELTFKARSGVAFWIMDRSYGLPVDRARTRPQDVIAGQGSDETTVCRKYSL
jgi:hypothetical protein